MDPRVSKLLSTPFFQQRLERFLFTRHRIPDARVEDLQILVTHPPIQAEKKAAMVFLGLYKTIPLFYEADRVEDPRTGVFQTY